MKLFLSPFALLWTAIYAGLALVAAIYAFKAGDVSGGSFMAVIAVVAFVLASISSIKIYDEMNPKTEKTEG